MPFYLPTPSPTLSNTLIISVIIPVRNEAKNIELLLEDLAQQTLLPACFEVWVIDDASEDDTAEIVRNFEASYALHLLPSDVSLGNLSPKKRAIQTALAHTAGKLIVCTDGDCRVQPDWLRLFAVHHEATGAHWISGGVAFQSPEPSFFDIFQMIEFSSLVGSGAITLAHGFPTMANGANLAYTRSAFEAVGGFEGNAHLASGDDEFLLHKIAKKFPKAIFFLKNPAHTVYTFPQKTLQDFYRQRKRWGSKWAHYKNVGIKLLAVAIFGANLALLMTWAGAFWGSWRIVDAIWLTGLKCVPEFFLLLWLVHYFQKPPLPARAIVGVQIVYPFYVVFFAFASLAGKEYTWKGRRLK